ncbi:MAG: response regulator [Bacteroidia bacterium]|nr:response regulator [Bacteroidia bacterium]
MFQGKYILIAEDDEDDQFLIKLAFKEISNEMNLVFVENGIELIYFFKKIEDGLMGLPALLVVDLNMPKKNGREALRELSQKNNYRQFPKVIFSTTGNELERSRCEELGINDYFVKPSDYNSLLAIVKEFQKMAINSFDQSW